MHASLIPLIKNFSSDEIVALHAIPWTSPVPVFGDVTRSRIATLGLNPSDKEFVDGKGGELENADRRFPTLKSLGLQSWEHAEDAHALEIFHACTQYFHRNPYDGWFKSLDSLIRGTGASYYSFDNPACHLDLIPYATRNKWGLLPSSHKEDLLSRFGSEFLERLRGTAVRVLVLNGASVVQGFEQATGLELKREKKPRWNLPRKSGEHVLGYAFSGDFQISRKSNSTVRILGYNHNIQSSFGVTNKVRSEIQLWISEESRK